MDVNFRKIDIDQFDEEVFKDSELYESDPRDPIEALEDAKRKQVAVRGLLARWSLRYLNSFSFKNLQFEFLGTTSQVL
jgi:hypothetical protein